MHLKSLCMFLRGTNVIMLFFWQVDDGRLVHIKGGLVDKLLYQITAVFCVIGLGISGKVLWDLSVPKKA